MEQIYERRVYVVTGREGPSYDPYGYTEYVVRVNGVNTILHAGLDEYISVDGLRLNYGYEHLDLLFESLTGLAPSRVEKIYNMRKYPTKCPHCGSRKLKDTQGFPGESLTVCGDCNEIIGCDFDESAII